MKEADLLHHLAHKIARISARSDIQSWCTFKLIGGVRWYDTFGIDQIAMRSVQDSVRYLRLRGLLVRHPCNSWLVRFRRPSSPEKAS